MFEFLEETAPQVVLSKAPDPKATVRLFHGPGSYLRSQEWIKTWGEILMSLGVDTSLKVGDVRDALDVVSSPRISRLPQALLIGLDGADQKALDPLLKTLEDGTGAGCPRLVLWVSDLTDVVPTVKSRCLALWSPGGEQVDGALLAQVSEHLSGGVASLVKGVPKNPRAWVDCLAVACLDGSVPLETWGRVRKLIDLKVPYLGLLDALLPQDPGGGK